MMAAYLLAVGYTGPFKVKTEPSGSPRGTTLSRAPNRDGCLKSNRIWGLTGAEWIVLLARPLLIWASQAPMLTVCRLPIAGPVRGPIRSAGVEQALYHHERGLAARVRDDRDRVRRPLSSGSAGAGAAPHPPYDEEANEATRAPRGGHSRQVARWPVDFVQCRVDFDRYLPTPLFPCSRRSTARRPVLSEALSPPRPGVWLNAVRGCSREHSLNLICPAVVANGVPVEPPPFFSTRKTGAISRGTSAIAPHKGIREAFKRRGSPTCRCWSPAEIYPYPSIGATSPRRSSPARRRRPLTWANRIHRQARLRLPRGVLSSLTGAGDSSWSRAGACIRHPRGGVPSRRPCRSHRPRPNQASRG